MPYLTQSALDALNKKYDTMVQHVIEVGHILDNVLTIDKDTTVPPESCNVRLPLRRKPVAENAPESTRGHSGNPIFYRYIRPLGANGEVDSQRGITMRILLNYDKRVVTFSFAICNHENGQPSFSKSIGRHMSRIRPTYDIPMWDKVGPLRETDVVEYIIK